MPDPGRSPARAPDPRPPGADHAEQRRPATARRDRRLGNGPHQLTCRQTEYTFGLAADALAKDQPGGLPSGRLQCACDDLLEASVPEQFKDASRSLAADWTDLESFSRPPPARVGDCAEHEASWGHRKNNLLRSEDELFYGYYFSAGIMMPDEGGPPVPEFARRATASSCRHDPVRAFTPVLTAMPAAGIPLGDVPTDSGYAHRNAGAWALPFLIRQVIAIQSIEQPPDLHDPATKIHGTRPKASTAQEAHKGTGPGLPARAQEPRPGERRHRRRAG